MIPFCMVDAWVSADFFLSLEGLEVPFATFCLLSDGPAWVQIARSGGFVEVPNQFGERAFVSCKDAPIVGRLSRDGVPATVHAWPTTDGRASFVVQFS